MKQISLSELTEMAGSITESNETIRFQTSKDSLICWATMVVLEGWKMYAVIIPSLTCVVEMSSEPLKENIISDFLSEHANDNEFDGRHVYLLD